jgi:hypothetical protein
MMQINARCQYLEMFRSFVMVDRYGELKMKKFESMLVLTFKALPDLQTSTSLYMQNGCYMIELAQP